MNRLRLLTVLVVALGALALFTLAGTAHADLMYQFDVHETTSLGFQPFSFFHRADVRHRRAIPRVHAVHRDLWHAFV